MGTDTKGTNHTEEAGKEQPKIEDAIPIEALEAVDLTMPDDYALDIMASEMVTHLQEYHKLVTQQRAYRQAEDHPRAEQLSKQILGHKMAVAVIQHKHPKAKAMADEMMAINAAQAGRNRAALAKAFASR